MYQSTHLSIYVCISINTTSQNSHSVQNVRLMENMIHISIISSIYCSTDYFYLRGTVLYARFIVFGYLHRMNIIIIIMTHHQHYYYYYHHHDDYHHHHHRHQINIINKCTLYMHFFRCRLERDPARASLFFIPMYPGPNTMEDFRALCR